MRSYDIARWWRSDADGDTVAKLRLFADRDRIANR
jgi:hypothetical protein